ncbi:MAG: hypothetical protein ACT4OV_01615 [Microthrixaceae bacterium]
MRRVAGRLLAACSLIGAVALVFVPAGGAEEPVFVGWWYRDVPLSDESAMQAQGAGVATPASIAGSPASGAQVPPPPTLPPAPIPTVPPDVTVPDPGTGAPTPSPAPDGGLLVAADPTGIRAMSALRFDPGDAGGAILKLTLAAGSTPSPGVRACPSLSDWLPGPDQAWSARPAHGCGNLAVRSTLSTDGTTMQWDLPDTFKSPNSDYYDVLLVPYGGDGTPFQIAFEAPGADALTVTSPAPEPPPPYESPDFVNPPSDYYDSGGYDFGNVDGSFTDPPLDTVGFEPTGNGRTVDRPPLERLADALENPTTRRIAALALILLGAYAYRESGRTLARAPQLLGALGGGQRATTGVAAPVPAVARGIGRFSRQRHGPAGRL